MLKRICLLIGMAIAGSFAYSQSLDVGIRLQKSVNLYYENGIAAQYSCKKLLPEKLYFGFSYVTSRLGSAFNSNAVKQDNYVISAAYCFGKVTNILRPFVRLNTGYFYADYGDKVFNDLSHSSAIAATDIGLTFQTHSPFKIGTSIGYNLITGDGLSGPGTLYPVFYQLTVSWDILKPHSK